MVDLVALHYLPFVFWKRSESPVFYKMIVVDAYLIVLILLGHGLLFRLSFTFVPMILEPDFHL